MEKEEARRSAEEIYGAFGEGNIAEVRKCATRIKIMAMDTLKVDSDALSDAYGVKGMFESGGYFNLVIGTKDVKNVYNELCDIARQSLPHNYVRRPVPLAYVSGNVPADAPAEKGAEGGNDMLRVLRKMAELICTGQQAEHEKPVSAAETLWIVATHFSHENGIAIENVYGSEKNVREYIKFLIQYELSERNPDGGEPEDIPVAKRGDYLIAAVCVDEDSYIHVSARRMQPPTVLE